MIVFLAMAMFGGLILGTSAMWLSGRVTQAFVHNFKPVLIIVSFLPVAVLLLLLSAPELNDALIYPPSALFIFGSPPLSFFAAVLLGKRINERYYIPALLNLLFACVVFTAGLLLLQMPVNTDISF